tara:strand:+ start:457 stop:639 length:183 start_codon:yes stop_codon:yes gene_type:complete
MNSIKMLEMALKQLREYSSNQWVIDGDEQYGIEGVLAKIRLGEPLGTRSRVGFYKEIKDE